MSSKHPLVQIGYQHFNESELESVHLLNDSSSNNFLNDIENYPHAFVLSCSMDKQIKAERAWMIPVLIRDEYGFFDIERLATISKTELVEVFNRRKLHRFNNSMAGVFLMQFKEYKMYMREIAKRYGAIIQVAPQWFIAFSNLMVVESK